MAKNTPEKLSRNMIPLQKKNPPTMLWGDSFKRKLCLWQVAQAHDRMQMLMLLALC